MKQKGVKNGQVLPAFGIIMVLIMLGLCIAAAISAAW